jgi:hypothetical protein
MNRFTGYLLMPLFVLIWLAGKAWRAIRDRKALNDAVIKGER